MSGCEGRRVVVNKKNVETNEKGRTMRAVLAETLRLLANEGENLTAAAMAAPDTTSATVAALKPSYVAYLTQFSWTSTVRTHGWERKRKGQGGGATVSCTAKGKT